MIQGRLRQVELDSDANIEVVEEGERLLLRSVPKIWHQGQVLLALTRRSRVVLVGGS
jgi:hypothetical protein